MIAKQQYHRLMKEYQSTENVTASAMKADISRPTARKYLEAQQPPDRLQVKHTWRTRPDPLAAIWPQAEAMLRQGQANVADAGLSRSIGLVAGNHIAVQALALFGEPLDERGRIGDLTLGFGERLALLGGHEGGEVRLVLDHEIEPSSP